MKHILDLVNDYEDMEAAFSKYYTTTLLSNSVTPSAIYDIEAKIDGYAVIDPMDIDDVNDLLYREDSHAFMNFCFKPHVLKMWNFTKNIILFLSCWHISILNIQVEDIIWMAK